MRRKFALLLLLISLAALPFSGCADAQEKQQDEQTQQTALQDTPDFQQADLPEEQQGVREQIDTLWAQLDTSELPRLNFTPLYRPFEEEFAIEDWPLQVLYPQDKTAYQLAAQICNLTYYYIGNVLPDFEGGPTWNMDDEMLLTALYRTTPINLGNLSSQVQQQIGKDFRGGVPVEAFARTMIQLFCKLGQSLCRKRNLIGVFGDVLPQQTVDLLV